MRDATDQLPARPGDTGGPTFRELWEAQAFAMALALHRRGLFSQSEWAQGLATAIASAQAAGDPDLGDTYYSHWLAALETLVVAKGLISRDEMVIYQRAWDRAARRTPHGLPLELQPDDLAG